MFSGAPGPFGDAVDALADLERQVEAAEGMEGAVLRFGWFYGPATSFAADGSQAEEVMKRRFPVIGKGAGTFSFIHVEDAAAATVATVERGARGIYNVVDDEPAPQRVWLPVYAEALGAKPPRRVPVWLGKLIAGRAIVANATGLRGASNAKAKRELGWQPRYASWRQGFREGLG
jgi:nucleoside-diphosphate-sugar epimerase